MRADSELSPHPRYRLLQQIGKGGMGEVFRTHDRLTGQVVALKRVRMPLPGALALVEGLEQTNLGQAITSAATSISRLLQHDATSLPQRSSDELQALRVHLTQEFRTLAGLRHPHIVSVIDYGFDRAHQPYFTMEYLDRATSLDAAARGKPVAVQVGLILQSLQALTYLHRRGILHREARG